MELFNKKKPFFVKRRALEGAELAKYGVRESRLTPQSSLGKVAVFGDVHANLEALEAVLKDAEGQGVSGFACTGDLVGYGPNPSECLEIVKALGCPVVKGNHDEYAATDISLKDFTLHAMNALIWTREHLTDEERSWLNALPMEWGDDHKEAQQAQESNPELAANEQREREEKSRLTDHGSRTPFHLVHSSVFEPQTWKYIIKQEEAEKVLPVQKQDLVFFGHTHLPSFYGFHPDSGAFRSTVPVSEGAVELEQGWKWLANPGSVGQPRDRDPRAAYAVYFPETGKIEFRRVEYDFRKTAKKIVEAGLPERNAQRLYKGR